jgi:pimeloyl-ACP methyl ester carboxylesterase
VPFIDIDGTKIHFEVYGTGASLVLLHALFSDSSAYRHFIGILSKQYKVYAVDMPNHGKSGTMKELFTIDDVVEILQNWANKVEVGPFVLIGHSAGGLVALNYASRYPVKELWLISPAGARLDFSLYAFLGKLLWKTVLSFGVDVRAAWKLAESGVINFGRNMFNRALWQEMARIFGREFCALMRQVKCPTVLFWAMDDVFLPRKTANSFLDNFSDIRLLEIDGPHDWPTLRPELILPFLEGPS